MNYGENGDMWISWHLSKMEDGSEDPRIKPIYDLVLNSEDMDDVKNRLEDNGFTHVDTQHGNCHTWVFANCDGMLVETYVFHYRQLTVTMREYSSGTPEKFMKFQRSFREICNMSPEEMQA